LAGRQPGTVRPESGTQTARAAGEDGGPAASEGEDRACPAHQAAQDDAERTSGAGGSRPATPAGPAGPPPSRADKRLYFALMGICIGLFVIAWAVVERYSVTAAVIISAAALAIPPFAVIIANVASATDRRRP
jgi:hypothetical protein